MPSELAPTTEVYRSVKRWDQIPNGQPSGTAFHRRSDDTRGLSVDFGVSVPDGCGLAISNKKAVLGLIVGRIQALEFGLKVIPVSDKATHANIDTAIPVYDPNDPNQDRIKLAEQIATALASISDVKWQKPKAL